MLDMAETPLQLFEVKVENRRDVERQELRDDQTAERISGSKVVVQVCRRPLLSHKCGLCKLGRPLGRRTARISPAGGISPAGEGFKSENFGDAGGWRGSTSAQVTLF